MARYIEDDSESGQTLLITAGVVAGLLAGAVVAQRVGGWRGMRRLLKGRRGALQQLIRRTLPSGTLGAVLDLVGVDRIVGVLLGEAKAGIQAQLDERVRSRRGTRGGALAGRRRRHDPELDEYEVDDFERAAAGLDDEEGETPAPPASARRPLRPRDDARLDGEDDATDDDLDDGEEDVIEEGPSPEAIEEAVLAAFRRHPVLRQRALEISVDDEGILELTGWVRAERELRIARRVAGRVEGVEQVIVDVAVRDGARTPVRAGVASSDETDDDVAVADH